MVYFVDDNFIGNRKATREMLPHLVAWQKRNGYPLQFACEATLNIAKQPEILELMRRGGLHDASSSASRRRSRRAEADATRSHNAKLPILESIETLNSYGLEVTSGIILGLDTDTAQTRGAAASSSSSSDVPVLTINLLQALPKTPLWDRLEKARTASIDDPALESNVRFLRPYDEVMRAWRRAHRARLRRRSGSSRASVHQVDATYGNRIQTPAKGKLNAGQPASAASLLG